MSNGEVRTPVSGIGKKLSLRVVSTILCLERTVVLLSFRVHTIVRSPMF